MAESFVERRRRELGLAPLTTSAPAQVHTSTTKTAEKPKESDFVTRRKIELGLLPDPKVEVGKKQVDSFKQAEQQFNPLLHTPSQPFVKPTTYSDFSANPAKLPMVQTANQYADDNPTWGGIIDNPIGRTVGKGLGAVGNVIDKVSHLPVINQVTGAMQGGNEPLYRTDAKAEKEPLWKKYIESVRDVTNLAMKVLPGGNAALNVIPSKTDKSGIDIIKNLSQVPKGAIQGALHPDAARKKLSDTLQPYSPATKMIAESVADPLSYVPMPSIKGIKSVASAFRKAPIIDDGLKIGDVVRHSSPESRVLSPNKKIAEIRPDTEFGGQYKEYRFEGEDKWYHDTFIQDAAEGAAATHVGHSGPILGLPEPKSAIMAREAERRSVLEPSNKTVLGRGEVATLGLPESNTPRIVSDIKKQAAEYIKPPTSRRDLILYAEKHIGVPRAEIIKLNDDELYKMGQMIRAGTDMEALHTKLAAEQGLNWGELVSGKSVTGNVEAPLNRIKDVRPPSESRTLIGSKQGEEIAATRELKPKPVTELKPKKETIKGVATKTEVIKPPKVEVISKSNPLKVKAEAQRTVSPDQKVAGIRANYQNQLKNGSVAAESTPKLSESRQFGTLASLRKSNKTSPKLIKEISKKGETTYDIKHNEETVANANQKLADEGHAGAKSYLMNKNEKEILSSDDVALGYRLIDELSSKGDHSGAADVSLKLMQSNLEGGRSVQINSIYDRLSKEGILRVATKQFNEGITKLSEQKALPAAVAERIDVAATKLKGATGNVQVSKEAISILDKAKSGEKLTDAEVSKLRQFASEAKKHIPEKDPVTRKRDKVVEYTSRQANMARKRIAASRNLNFAASTNGGNPIIDRAIIGVDYMVKGAVKFADYAENMVKEFGKVDSLDETFNESWKRYRRLNDIKMSEFEKMTDQAIINHSISPQKANVLRRMAIEFSQLEGKVQNEALGELQQTFNSFKEGTKGQKAAALLRTAQLGNVRTLLRNEIGNNLFYALDTLRRKFIATPIDLMTSWKGNRDVFFKNNPESWLQYFKDWRTGYKAGKLGINPNGLETQYDLGSLAFNPNSKKLTTQVASFLERQVGAVMKAGDYASANRAISTETYQIAQKRAYSEGFRGKALRDKAESYYYTADEKMQEAALEYGKYMTFQDKNFLSDAAMKVKDTLNFGKDFGLGNVFFNYPKTPANIFMRAVDYSPLGFVKFMGQASGLIKGAEKAQMINTFSRAIAGTAMGSVGAYLAYIGLINVLPSKNKDLNSLERNAGIIPNSVNLDGLYRFVKSFGDKEAAKPRVGDKYATVDWLQPMAITGSAGAALGQSQTGSRLDKTVNAAGAVIQALGAATDSATNMSVYKNIKNLFGKDYESKSDYIGRLIASAATAGIPSIVGQIRNSTDANTRETKNPDVFKQVGNVVANKIPKLSDNLPKKIDTLGKEVKSDYGVFGRIFNAFVNPSLMDTYKPSEGAKVVLDIVNRTGQIKAAPSTAPKSFMYKSEKYVFNPTEYQGFQENLGMLVDEGIQTNLEYLKSDDNTDEQKVTKLEKIMTESLETAKKGARKTMKPILGK